MYKTYWAKRYDICDGNQIYSKRIFKTEGLAIVYSKFIAIIMDICTKGCEYGIIHGVEKIEKSDVKYVKERSNVIQYDMMGYPSRLIINRDGEQVWIDTEAETDDVVLVWKTI